MLSFEGCPNTDSQRGAGISLCAGAWRAASARAGGAGTTRPLPGQEESSSWRLQPAGVYFQVLISAAMSGLSSKACTDFLSKMQEFSVEPCPSLLVVYWDFFFGTVQFLFSLF